jgi:type IV secretory pathway VirB3-like protein
MPRYFGVTPPTLLFGVATAILAFAVALAIVGHWIAAVLLALIAIGLLALFVSGAKQRPDTTLARASARRLDRARDRAGWLVESLAARTDADRNTRRLRYELLQIEEERNRLLRELGEAVYSEDKKATASVKEELSRLDESVAEKEAEMGEIAAAAQKRLETARLSAQATIVASVPEPSPPPDEGTPPAPAPIPEPGPPPDEGTPPTPDPVPDPASPPNP